MSKYLNPKNYARRALALLNRRLLGRIESLLAPDADQPLRHPPIFFLGAPRSGSTLMIQVITDALNVGYISNRHCQWYGAPVLAEHLFHPLANKPSSDYRSDHGTTNGPHAPAECGEWWYRFFRRRPPYVTVDDLDPLKMCAFRRSIAALTNAMDKPLVFKNLYASLRIQAIAKFIPESLFVVVHRDEVDNGHSLLEARFKSVGNYDAWFSVEPPEVERLKALAPQEQVIEQIRHIHRTIDDDLKVAAVPANRRLDLSYEAFCSDPRGGVESLQGFLQSHGCDVKRLGAIPEPFERREEVRISQPLYKAMARYSSESR